jgi:hypothetical protein
MESYESDADTSAFVADGRGQATWLVGISMYEHFARGRFVITVFQTRQRAPRSGRGFLLERWSKANKHSGTGEVE